MDDTEAAKLRMQCLQLAVHIALASCAGSYNIPDDAKKYWKFVCGDADRTPAKPDDVIPF